MKKQVVIDPDSSYVLKITLQEIKPPIWRRLVVPALDSRVPAPAPAQRVTGPGRRPAGP